MYTCMLQHTCVHTYIHTHMLTHVLSHTHVLSDTHTCAHTPVHTRGAGVSPGFALPSGSAGGHRVPLGDERNPPSAPLQLGPPAPPLPLPGAPCAAGPGLCAGEGGGGGGRRNGRRRRRRGGRRGRRSAARRGLRLRAALGRTERGRGAALQHPPPPGCAPSLLCRSGGAHGNAARGAPGARPRRGGAVSRGGRGPGSGGADVRGRGGGGAAPPRAPPAHGLLWARPGLSAATVPPPAPRRPASRPALGRLRPLYVPGSRAGLGVGGGGGGQSAVRGAGLGWGAALGSAQGGPHRAGAARAVLSAACGAR